MTPLTLLALLACSGDKGPDDSAADDSGADDSGAPADYAVMTTVSSDYATGSFAAASLADRSVDDGLFVTSGDPKVVVEEGAVFQLNRFGYDTLRRYAAGDWSAPLWEIETGDGSNPADVDLCGGDLFVSLYAADQLAVYDADAGILIGAVDLSAYADGDGVGPEPSSMVEVDGTLFVAMNRMDREAGWVSVGGVVAAVDCAAREVVDDWEIGGNTEVFDWPGRDAVLVVAEAYGEDAEGLYALDPDGGEDSVTRIAGGEALGEIFGSVAAWEDRAVVTSLAQDYSHYGISCVDLDTGEVSVVEEVSSHLLSAASNARGEAWIASHWGWIDPEGAAAGAIVYDIATCSSLTAGSPVAPSLAPTSIGFASW